MTIALTIPDAAKAVGVTDKVIRAAIHAGELKAKRQSRNEVGEGQGKYLISSKALEAWFESLADA